MEIEIATRAPRWLLWDVENCPAPPGRERSFLESMLDVAGPVDRVVASGAPAILLRYQRALCRSAIDLSPAPQKRNGADFVLLAAVAGRPYIDVVIASNDAVFASLGRAGHRCQRHVKADPGAASES